jgi:hypothetical protein
MPPLFLSPFSDPIYNVDNFSKQADLKKKFEKEMGNVLLSLGLKSWYPGPCDIIFPVLLLINLPQSRKNSSTDRLFQKNPKASL